MSTDVVQLITTALDRTGRIVHGIAAEQLSDRTPCDAWDVEATLNHLVGGVQIFAALVAGEPAPGEHEQDWLGDDPLGAWHAAAAADLDAWTRPDALEGTVELSFGVLPAPLAGWIHLTELVVHGIDLAVATGQDDRIDQAVAVQLLGAMRAMGFEAFRIPGSFDAEVPAPPHAVPHEQLMAFLGRAVSPRASAVS